MDHNEINILIERGLSPDSIEIVKALYLIVSAIKYLSIIVLVSAFMRMCFNE